MSEPIEILLPKRQSAPVVFSSPHSGRDYPPGFVAASKLDPLVLRRSEDVCVDLLFARAPEFGAPLLKANFPRAFVDPNREPYELDPAMFDGRLPEHVNTGSPRVAAGLGTIARVVARGVDIYRDKLTFTQAADRIERCYRPYHDALTNLVESTKAQFGHCIVIDCHSMPSAGGPSPNAAGDGVGSNAQRGVDFVLGNANGRSCEPPLIELAEETLISMGYTVRQNIPYPGGFITDRYGHPKQGLHSLQIEINRALYLDEKSLELKNYWKDLADDMAQLISAVCCVKL